MGPATRRHPIEPTHKWVVRPFVVPPLGGFSRCSLFQDRLKAELQTIHASALYFVDVYGLPVQEYWHDMKFWWPQNEAIIATLMAFLLTGDAKYGEWHRQIHDWAYRNFPDPEFSEWFGYLHRDGRLSVPPERESLEGSVPFAAYAVDVLAASGQRPFLKRP